MDDTLPSELLLLAQAVVQFGTSQSDVLARAMQARLAATADPSRAARFTPQACMQLLDKMLAAEALDGTRLNELKEPGARTSMKLARKYYTARLAELRDKLGIQEELMKTLLAEEKDIQSGAWDEKLTQGYELVTASAEPTQALYKHKFGAGTVEDAQKEAEEGATLKSAVPQSASTTATNSVQPEPPLPKEEAASPAKELQFAEQPISAPETSMDVDAAPMSRPEREGTAGSALQDVPEEDEGNEVEVEGTDAHTQKEEEEEEENEEARAGKADHEGEASAASTTSRQTRRSAQPVSAKASSSTGIGRGSLPERRSSNRVSRTSIANLSEIVPSTSSDAAEVTITSPPAAALPEEGTSPSRERDVVAPSSEGMDVDASSAGMERDDSKDSTAGQVASTTASTTTAKRGRPPRKSSVPPISTKDANKRKRTTTPQAQNKATSPAPSERSRSKRVKTEEPESGLGTPVEPDRTPGTSDASAIRRFRNSAPHLISQMISSVNSTYFKEPVRPGEAKNYFEIIKKPMDLKTLLQNVKNGRITNSAEFTRDLALIFANAIMYNGQDHHVGQDAVNMWKEAQGLLRVLEAAEQRAI